MPWGDSRNNNKKEEKNVAHVILEIVHKPWKMGLKKGKSRKLRDILHVKKIEKSWKFLKITCVIFYDFPYQSNIFHEIFKFSPIIPSDNFSSDGLNIMKKIGSRLRL